MLRVGGEQQAALHLESLPVELLAHVFARLPPDGISAVVAVCSALRTAVHSCAKRVTFTRPYDPERDAALMAQLRACPCLTNADVSPLVRIPDNPVLPPVRFWPTEQLDKVAVLHLRPTFPLQHLPPRLKAVKLAAYSMTVFAGAHARESHVWMDTLIATLHASQPQCRVLIASAHSSGSGSMAWPWLRNIHCREIVRIQSFERHEPDMRPAYWYHEEGDELWLSLAPLLSFQGLSSLNLTGCFRMLTSLSPLTCLTALTQLVLPRLKGITSLRELDSATLPQLVSLSLHPIGSSEDRLMSGRLSRLRELHLTNPYCYLDDDLDVHIREATEPPESTTFTFLRDACLESVTRLKLEGNIGGTSLVDLACFLPNSLVRLELEGLEDLQALELPRGAFPALEHLSITDCGCFDSLGDLPPMQLSCLQTLTLRLRSSYIQYTFDDDNIVESDEDMPPHHWGLTTFRALAWCSLPALQTLSISGMLGLVDLGDLAGAQLPALRTLELCDCGITKVAGVARAHMPRLDVFCVASRYCKVEDYRCLPQHLYDKFVQFHRWLPAADSSESDFRV